MSKYVDDDDYEPEDEELEEDEEVIGKTDKKKEDEDEEEEDVDVEDDDYEEDEDEDDDDATSEYDINDVAIVKQESRPNGFAELSDTDDEDDDEDEEDARYLQKFDENIQKNIIAEWHPELQQGNNDEIDILSRVVRDANGVIIDPLHRTLPFITRYEKARILGERAKQINSGAPLFTEVDTALIDGYLIALKEFEEKKIPFIIKRPLPNGGCEYWKFKDLEILS